ncbi:MAG: Unknown protein [uncultured Thiotrichaceae bacterium]|uniref:Chalcone isomerase domain-containing protein n=1 Tax=uncultured Thiotrichaceae bacterium TaxID=298394 RepID=A0A6S6UI55_9GAMM|nr:MAG: Unknown protein [uncultured Thiotrichaceae bacterium]
MDKILLLIVSGLFSVSVWANIPEQLTKSVTGEVRYLGFIKVYDATLYTQANATPENLLLPEVSRCLKLNYAVDLSKDKFILATKTVLERQNTAEDLGRVAKQMQLVNNSYTDIKKGDRYVMCFDRTSQHTKLYLNEKPVLSLAKSAEFAKVYMGMWLANKQPISVSLRNTFMNHMRKM